MASLLRIKRSATSGNPSALGQGELAYSYLADNGSNGGDRLYIGTGSEIAGNAVNHEIIGGKYFTAKLDHALGTLTPNSAILVDANSKIDVLNVDNLTLNGNTISTTDTNGNLIVSPHGSGVVSVAGSKISHLLTPTADSDATTKAYVDGSGGGTGPFLPLAGGTMTGTITMNNNRITSIEELRFNNGGNIGNQINTDVDTGTETVANVEIATYTAAFFDFVIKKTTNVRSGTVYACHDGTNVEFTETSTNDLGDTSDVTLSVDISGTNMRLLATVTSDDWSVKSLIRAI